MPKTWTSPSAQYTELGQRLVDGDELDVLPQATTPGADTRPKATLLSDTFMMRLMRSTEGGGGAALTGQP